jgi:serine/threonine-protein kinase
MLLPVSSPGGVDPLRIGKYEVVSHLATGGMAQIYLARQSGLGEFERHVVLKTILRERASDRRFVTMFLDEAKLAATLNHHNVAQVYEVDQADGQYFMAMEYVHGENVRAMLETTIRRGWTVPLELAVLIVSGAAAGLHHAHERRGRGGAPLNIVHRDVSPANVMVGFDGSVKVLDFGIAKAEERATKTVGGTIKGKYGYMSPEQCKGKSIDRRSDIFALGIVLYELTTLRRAFKGQDDFDTMKRIVAGDIMLPSVAVPGYPPELEAIVRTAMAVDVTARFQSAAELIEALDAFTVRAKLTCSNTAMARFMTQLFGAKKEPWVDGAAAEDGGLLPAYGDDDDEEQQTALIEAKVPKDTLRGYGDRGDGASDPAGTEVLRPRAATTSERPVARIKETLPQALVASARSTGALPSAAGPRTSGVLPTAGPRMAGVLPGTLPGTGGPMAAAATGAGISGGFAAATSPARGGGEPDDPLEIPVEPGPQLPPADPPLPPVSNNTGAQSLITDDKLGWETHSNVAVQPLPPDPSGTALDATGGVVKHGSRRRWWVIAGVVWVIVAGVLVLIALQ